MGNTILTPDVIAREVLIATKNNLVMGNLIHRTYKEEFVEKIGDTVKVKKPVRFDVGDGDDITNTVQDIVQQSIDVEITHRKHVAYELSGKELTLDVKQFGKEFAQPAGETLAQDFDSACCGMYNELFYNSGIPGATPSKFSDLGAMGQVLDEMGVPERNRRLVLNPAASWAMADSLKGLFLENMVRTMIQKGRLTNLAGFDIYTTQNIKRHVWTQFTTNTPAIAATITNDATEFTMDGWVGTLNKGDILTIAGMYAVNPNNHETLTWLHPMVVTETVTAASALTAYTVKISPKLITGTGTLSRAYKNIDAYPVNDAAVTVYGSHAANLAFHKNCLAAVTVPIAIPESATYAARSTYDGLSVRVLKFMNGMTDKEYMRFDIMFGLKAIYPELGGVMFG